MLSEYFIAVLLDAPAGCTGPGSCTPAGCGRPPTECRNGRRRKAPLFLSQFIRPRRLLSQDAAYLPDSACLAACLPTASLVQVVEAFRLRLREIERAASTAQLTGHGALEACSHDGRRWNGRAGGRSRSVRALSGSGIKSEAYFFCLLLLLLLYNLEVDRSVQKGKARRAKRAEKALWNIIKAN